MDTTKTFNNTANGKGVLRNLILLFLNIFLLIMFGFGFSTSDAGVFLSYVAIFVVSCHVVNNVLTILANISGRLTIDDKAIVAASKKIAFKRIRSIVVKANVNKIHIYTKTQKITIYISDGIIGDFVTELNLQIEKNEYNINIYSDLLLPHFLSFNYSNLPRDYVMHTAIWLRLILYIALFSSDIPNTDFAPTIVFLIEGAIMPIALFIAQRKSVKLLEPKGVMTFRKDFLTYENRIIYYSSVKELSNINDDLHIVLNDGSKIELPDHFKAHTYDLTNKDVFTTTYFYEELSKKLKLDSKSTDIQENTNEEQHAELSEENNITDDEELKELIQLEQEENGNTASNSSTSSNGKNSLDELDDLLSRGN